MAYTANSVPFGTTAPTHLGMDKESVLEHKRNFKSKSTGQDTNDFMSADVTQFLALGLIAFDEVQAAANYEVMQTRDFAIGKVFDLFTAARPDHLDYVEHVITVALELQPDDVVTQEDIFLGSYYKVRQQVKIKSALKKEVDEDGTVLGHYFEIERRNLLSSGKALGKGWDDGKLLGAGIHESHKLYARLNDSGVPNGEFYMLNRDDEEVYVELGDTSVWSGCIQDIADNNLVKRYHKLLASVDRDTKVRWYKKGYAIGGANAAQQFVFWNVFKMFKAEADFQIVDTTTVEIAATEPANA
jgi:hypothetical protein